MGKVISKQENQISLVVAAGWDLLVEGKEGVVPFHMVGRLLCSLRLALEVVAVNVRPSDSHLNVFYHGESLP